MYLGTKVILYCAILSSNIQLIDTGLIKGFTYFLIYIWDEKKFILI